MNSFFKGTPNLHVIALVSATYYRMRSLFVERGAQWNAVLKSRQTFIDYCIKVMKKETTNSNTHQVRIFYYNQNTFIMKETMDHDEWKPMEYYKVNLINSWCDCGKF